jgi:hypothetical protein
MEDRQNHGGTESCGAKPESWLTDHNRRGRMNLLNMILSCHDSVGLRRWHKDSSQLANNLDYCSTETDPARARGPVRQARRPPHYLNSYDFLSCCLLCTAMVEIARTLRRNSAASRFSVCPFPSIGICFGFRVSGFGFPAPPGCGCRISFKQVARSWNLCHAATGRVRQ